MAQHVLEVGEDALDDRARCDRFEEAIGPRDAAAGMTVDDVDALGRVDDPAFVERVDEEPARRVGEADDEMPWQPDAVKTKSDAPRDLDDDDGQRYRDAGAPFENG